MGLGAGATPTSRSGFGEIRENFFGDTFFAETEP